MGIEIAILGKADTRSLLPCARFLLSLSCVPGRSAFQREAARQIPGKQKGECDTQARTVSREPLQ